MSEKITMENFSDWNRDRRIGNSLYRICRNENGLWYIHECYNDGSEWSRSNNFHSKNLSEVIDKINRFTREKEVISLRF